MSNFRYTRAMSALVEVVPARSQPAAALLVPGMHSRRHLEACVFSHLVAELRSGDIAVTGSDSYTNLNAQLMSWEECEPLAAQFCEQAGIPAEASALVAYYRRQLSTAAAEVDAGYPAAGGRRPAPVGAGAGAGGASAAARAQPARHPDRVAAPSRAGVGVGPEDPR
ncbi:hypothetical protein ABZ260_41900 [Streptosporangium sp. NPDC006013]|uniref:hypothetical protein n=1 Tax=Streptosporangium sp. NPDC006013 TaxID=3155596 RepID=UPI0033A696E3